MINYVLFIIAYLYKFLLKIHTSITIEKKKRDGRGCPLEIITFPLKMYYYRMRQQINHRFGEYLQKIQQINYFQLTL